MRSSSMTSEPLSCLWIIGVEGLRVTSHFRMHESHCCMSFVYVGISLLHFSRIWSSCMVVPFKPRHKLLEARVACKTLTLVLDFAITNFTHIIHLSSHEKRDAVGCILGSRHLVDSMEGSFSLGARLSPWPMLYGQTFFVVRRNLAWRQASLNLTSHA